MLCANLRKNVLYGQIEDIFGLGFFFFWLVFFFKFRRKEVVLGGVLSVIRSGRPLKVASNMDPFVCFSALDCMIYYTLSESLKWKLLTNLFNTVKVIRHLAPKNAQNQDIEHCLPVKQYKSVTGYFDSKSRGHFIA